MPHFECSCCNKIFHANCYKPSKSELINDNIYCIDCKASIPKKYNPFKTMIDCLREDDIDPYLQKISDILEAFRNKLTGGGAAATAAPATAAASEVTSVYL